MLQSNVLSQALVSLLLGNAPRIHAAAQTITETQSWLHIVDLAHTWKVLPRLRKQIDHFNLPLPDAVRQLLHQKSKTVTLLSNLFAYGGAKALTQLQENGIPAIAFKGVGLIGNLYENPSDRSLGDIDLLVRATDIVAACEALKTIGFSYETTPLLDQLLHQSQVGNQTAIAKLIKQSTTFPCNPALTLFDERRLVRIDLHWGLSIGSGKCLDTETILKNAATVNLLGMDINVAAVPQSMLLTVHHAMRSNLRPSSTVKDLCDLRAWWEKKYDAWQLNDVLQQADDWKFSHLLLAMWQILSDYNPDSPIVNGIEELSSTLSTKQRQSADAFASYFQLQLETGEFNNDVLRVFDRQWVKGFIGRKIARIHYLNDSQISERFGTVDNASFSFGTRIKQVVRELRSLNSQKLSAYRSFARLNHDIGLK